MKTRARLISARFAIGPGRNNHGTLVGVHLPLGQDTQSDDAA